MFTGLKNTLKYGLNPRNNPEERMSGETILEWHQRRMGLLTGNKLEMVNYVRDLMRESPTAGNKKAFYCMLMDLVAESITMRGDDSISDEGCRKLFKEVDERHEKS